jgi:hydroxymethylpyrimidine pyrophosphatase-like HAD family hydrolase
MRPIKILSTDFDGTLHSDYEDPPIPVHLQEMIAEMQREGAHWVINTGRDLPSLMESIARARLKVRPDYLALVEREIYSHDGAKYVPLAEWNQRCEADHADIFAAVRPRLRGWIEAIEARFAATIYSDAYSPLCVIAGHAGEADELHAWMDECCAEVPELTVVRNDVYARLSHRDYNKATVLTEISRLLGVRGDEVLAAGDHFNDLPMLAGDCATRLVAPGNAVEAVKSLVRRNGGFVSDAPCGHGVAEGLAFYRKNTSAHKIS